MHRVGEILAGFPEGPGGQELEKERQVVRQLVGGHLEAVRRVELLQLNHRLPPVPALPVHVLEEVQRQRTRPVEQEDVALLEVVEIAPGKLGGEPAKRLALPLRHEPFPVEHRGEGRGRRRDPSVG